MSTPSKRVHLVGSLSLESSSDVFKAVAVHVGDQIARIPDGETGERATPFPMRKSLTDSVRNNSGIRFVRNQEILGINFAQFGLAPGVRQQEVELGPLGFAAEALRSYGDFRRLRAAGVVPAGVRMQVSLPAPFMIAFVFSAPELINELWPVFERAMLRELRKILDAVPHEDLAIQWDINPEVTEVLERRSPILADIVSRNQLVTAIARITEAVPPAIEVGWHLCYGDTGTSTEDRETHHVVEPRDLAVLVGFANDICAATRRSVDWVHMPVPRERHDDAYFAPLRALRLKPGTQLFLGLVHQFDGVEGAARRIAAARAHYEEFGVGTECGMGRRRPQDIPKLLDLHRDIALTLRDSGR
jgi:hypothetical protein